MDKHGSETPPAGVIVTCYLVVGAWYASNIGVLLLNKWLLSTTLRQPVFLTLCQLVVCSMLGFGCSRCKFFPLRPLRSRGQFVRICILSVLFCTTIVLGNSSLKYIPVSFNQMLGAAAPLFTAAFAACIMRSRERPLTYLTLVPITGGIVIASGAETKVHLFGCIICLTATAVRALKTVIQAMLLTDTAEKLDSMSLLFYMCSISVVLLAGATAMLEPGAFGTTVALVRQSPAMFGWILGNSCLAYAVNLTNFLVTKHTSALTLQVLGNMKGVMASIVSVCVFHNSVTATGWLGYAVTVVGVFAYSESKRRGGSSISTNVIGKKHAYTSASLHV